MSKPEAFISVKKNRRKQHENLNEIINDFDHAVFLRDDQEFEIELDNPTNDVYLAKIKLSGDFISNSGIVLRPGEHVFLERYIDEKKRFKFDTYEVPERNKKAIKDNGNVEVKFYKKKPNFINDFDYNKIKIDDNYGSPYVPNTNPKPYFMSSDNVSSTYTYDDSINASLNTQKSISSQSEDNVETGRVEKGSESNQSFGSVNKNFNSFPNYTTKIKLLPKSRKPVEKEEIRVYCTNCGAKFKKNWNFCAHCGTEKP